MSRGNDLERFYEILSTLRRRVGGERRLVSCEGFRDWPRQGMYFFFEPGELRDDGHTLRVVRVGTHAVSANSRSTLWQRLRAHRGTTRGRYARGGNHRGSIFRLHVGSAMLQRDFDSSVIAKTWSVGQSAPAAIRLIEHELEQRVSHHIGTMPFLWLRVEDEASSASLRRYLERSAIALLSNAVQRPPLDPPSPSWLGHHSANAAIRASGLWNVDGVYETYDPAFLATLEEYVNRM